MKKAAARLLASGNYCTGLWPASPASAARRREIADTRLEPSDGVGF